MWIYCVQTPARAFRRALITKYSVHSIVLYPQEDVASLQSHLFVCYFLLQLTGEVYNLHIDMVMRRARSRQQSNP